MQVIAHGGAGGEPDEPEARQAVLDEAAADGAARADPVAAAVATVRRLEDSPRFNAGVGGAVQSDGVVRTDAGLMTSDRRLGGACSMPGVAHAAEVARLVMAETPHVSMAGVHAVDLADAFDVDTGVELLTADTREGYEAADPPDGDVTDELAWVEDRFAGTDTVGAVARDGDDLAAVTSTAGRRFALRGRVGDVPQVGAGFYAAPAGGASATGAGEDIARVTLARQAVDRLADGADAAAAAEAALAEFEAVTGSTAGLIVQDADGDTGHAFNSAAMQTAVAAEE
ncbi:MAG: isoaspartyl peptidase/L-asparaginase [Halobacteriaceae archaeon]